MGKLECKFAVVRHQKKAFGMHVKPSHRKDTDRYILYKLFDGLSACVIGKCRNVSTRFIQHDIYVIFFPDKLFPFYLYFIDGRVGRATVSGNDIQVDGVFIELGAKSAADLAMDMDVMPEMDDSIKVKEDCSTDVPGVFACGDVTGKPWQVAKAVGQGAVAGISAADYVKGMNNADQ